MNRSQIIKRCMAGWLLACLMFASTPALSFTISPLFDLTLGLDGVDDYAIAPDHPSLDLGTIGDFTIEVFLFIADPDSGDEHVLVWKNNAYSLEVLYDTGDLLDRIVFTIYTSPSTFDFATYNVQLTPGWHHIAAIFDNDYSPTEYLIALYLDGNRFTTLTDFDISGIPDTDEPVTIGANSVSNPTAGWLEEIRFSDIVRYTAEEYEVPTAPFAPDEHTRALWHFDEVWGATEFQDASIHANTLTGVQGAQIGNPTGIIPPPLPFNKLSPADLSSEAEINPALTWESSAGAVGYQVCIETDWNDSCDGSWIDAGSNISLIPPTLDAYTQYQWQVRASNQVSTTYANDGQWWTFTTRDIAQPGPVYIVTVPQDTFDGLCGIKHCTLREAIAESEADEQASTIELQPGNVYTLDSTTPITAYNYTAFTITEELTLQGHGSVIERDAALDCVLDGVEHAGEFRLFLVTYEGKLYLNQLTLRNGCSDGDPKTALESGLGGAIYNQGVLELTQTTLDHNQSRNGGGGLFHNGNYGLQVTSSTFSHNTTNGFGGGLLNGGFATLTNSTFSTNRSSTDGGGIYNLNTGQVTMNFVTIAANVAEGAGGGIANLLGGALELQNSLTGGNWNGGATASDCAGSISSLGYNLVGSTTGCDFFPVSTDLLNTPSYLLPLSDNGGFTLTHALWAFSSAIDRIPYEVNGCGTDVQVDQRGIIRPQDAQKDGQAACDIGAVEMLEVSIVLTNIYLPILAVGD